MLLRSRKRVWGYKDEIEEMKKRTAILCHLCGYVREEKEGGNREKRERGRGRERR